VTLILANLVEMLNFCDVEDEAYESSTSPPVSSSFKVVHKHSESNHERIGGAVQLVSDPLTMDHFSPDLCHSVALGQPYESDTQNPPCSHFSGDVGVHALCYPLLIQREIVGILSLSIPMMRTPPLASKIPSTIRITRD